MTAEGVRGPPASFTHGVELCRRYWHQIVAPIVSELMPAAPRAAAVLGTGSDVLGFDRERSTDHGWGPRVLVFMEDGFDLSAERQRTLAAAIDARLPPTFGGFQTRFVAHEAEPPRHQVLFTRVDHWFRSTLDFDPRAAVAPSGWLSAPSQLLRSATAGAVFEDDADLLTEARTRLQWYPDDVWLYLLACQWRRIEQEEPFVGRTGEVGDDLGSALVTARLVRDLMRLCFLIEREYAPYTKWLGTAFARLRCAPTLKPELQEALSVAHWKQREAALVPAYHAIARSFNELGIAEWQPPTVRNFYDRPFRVLAAGRFAAACMEKTSLAYLGYTGAIDQFVDNTDVLSVPRNAQRMRAWFAPG